MSGPTCPACHSDATSTSVAAPQDLEYFKRRKDPVAIMRCLDCRSAFQHPWPSETETATFYDAAYQNYTTSSVPLLQALNRWHSRRGARAFKRQFGADPRLSVLDFGCGHGGFLASLLEEGYTDLTGFDVVSTVSDAVRKRVRVIDGFSSLARCGRTFDVIRLNHVIEHLTDLDGTMGLLRALMSAGGRLVGGTPNADHYTFRLMSKYWGPLHYPYHTILFSVKGLEAAAKRWGFRLISVRETILTTAWSMTAENAFKALTGSRRAARTQAYVLFIGLSLPLALWDRLVMPGHTAMIDFALEPI
jgi:SAM-dependent methyltransferase